MRVVILTLTVFMIFNVSANAETLIYKDVLEKAVNNSYDIKISKVDIKISDTEIKEARAEYFPVISANYNTEYNKDLTGGTSSFTSVGDSVVVNNTRYQNAIYAGIQYNLFDFGIRRKKLDIAKKGKFQKQIEGQRNLRDLKLNLSQTYTQALLLNRELNADKELLTLNKTLFAMYEDLYKSGITRKTTLTDQALQVAVLINRIDNVKTELGTILEDISYYTKEQYSVSAKILNLFEEEDGIIPISNKIIKLEVNESKILDTEELPEYKQYQAAIEIKQNELSILKRQNLPTFRFYTNYYLYGTDKDSFFKTFDDFGQRTLMFRIASTLPVFDGFRNKAKRDRAKLEIEKLELERDKRVESIKSYHRKAYKESLNAEERLENQEKALQLTEEKISMLEKLNDEKLIDKISYLKEKTGLITQKSELEKTRINCEAAAYRLRILSGNNEGCRSAHSLLQPTKDVETNNVSQKLPVNEMQLPKRMK